MRASFRTGLWALATALLSSMPAMAEVVTLSGQVTYQERVALPAGATLRIRLLDLTEAETPARVDVRAPVGTPGQVPLSFALNFDDLALVEGHEHGIVVDILAGAQPWFRNPEPYRLDPIAPTAPVVILTAPVQSPETTGSTTAGGASAQAAEFIGATWRATEISGMPVADDVDTTLLVGADNRAGGRGGCNNYFAQAQVNGMRLSFGPAAATRMACVSEAANAQETAYLGVLPEVRGWRIDEDGTLVFLDAEDEVVVRFAPMTR